MGGGENIPQMKIYKKEELGYYAYGPNCNHTTVSNSVRHRELGSHLQEATPLHERMAAVVHHKVYLRGRQ